MKKEMLMNVLQPEESRIAIVEDGTLQELYVERNSLENYVGNIYKGRVVNIEPSIQAAFVDFGVGRNGFLHVSDVEYQYYKHLVDSREGDDSDADDGDEEDVRPSRTRGKFNERSVRNKPPIQEILKRNIPRYNSVIRLDQLRAAAAASPSTTSTATTDTKANRSLHGEESQH